MDVQMPELDGFESTQKIREWESVNGSHIPIIAMTAHAMTGDRERCIASGMDDYITKPIDSKTLNNVLTRWLEDVTGVKTKHTQSNGLQEQKFSQDLEDGLFGEENDLPSRKSEVLPEIPLTFSPPEIPVDLEGALFRFAGDQTFLFEMCKQFRDHLPERIKEIKSAHTAGDNNSLARHAHTLKGVSLNFEAAFLAELAGELEERCTREDPSNMQLLIQQIEIEANRVEEYLIQKI
jgi:HPt (histidine-containing phosphotransfer) domain-containing protein